jgi:hypothetical protein
VKKAGSHKEKSVLQAKLTKLAIKIGYVGKIGQPECFLLYVCLLLLLYRPMTDNWQVLK